MVKLERNSGVPLYVQVARMVSRLIADGTWPPGLKLPPERQMARIMGVSRNTTSACYRYLLEQGLVISCQGRGTYVSGQPPEGVAPELVDSAGSLAPMVDILLEMGVERGVEPSATAALVAQRAGMHLSREPALVVAFIECNREQLDFFSQHLNLGPGVRIVPVIWPDTGRRDGVVDACAGADLVVTTFFHLDQVRSVLGERHQVVGIALDPDVETIVRVAQLPADRPVGLVCLSPQFADRVQKSLVKAGLGNLQIKVHTPGGGDLESFLEEVGGAIVSPGRSLEVTRALVRELPVIEFIYYPDHGSTRMLARRLAQLTGKGPTGG